MRSTLWSAGLAALALGSVAMVGGTALDGTFGPLIAGYGLLVALAALYLVVGLFIRDRVRRRTHSGHGQRPSSDRLAGRRVF